MSSADTARSRGRFSAFRRLDLLYFVLAGFDLLTIFAVLALNHTVTSAFETGVRTSAAWSSRQAEIISLGQLAQQTMAPGNDVFSTGDIDGERARYLAAYEKFNAEWRRASNLIANDPLSASDGELLSHLSLAYERMKELARRSESIFTEYEQQDVIGAGRHMAAMDRAFALVNESMDEAQAFVERMRGLHLQEQLSKAREMRTLEYLVAVAVLVIVCLVAAYGLHIGRTMRVHQELRLAMLGEVAAARDRLQRYADDVSHELRGPISKMRLDAEVLLRQDRPAAQYREGIEATLVECERVSAIVESLLFLARAENTRVVPNAQKLDVRHELSLIVEFFAAAAEKANVRLALSPGEGIVWADRPLFQRAVSNLVSNALDHTPPGGRVSLRPATGEDSVIIDVTDNGASIPDDALHQVFDRFYRGGGERNGKGLGLGLAITRSIMDLHRGSIELDSKSGVGTRATLVFPKTPPPSPASGENYRPVISR